jgi:hypothetical protein
MCQNGAALLPGGSFYVVQRWVTGKNAAPQIYLNATPGLGSHRFSLRFPTVISAGAKIFSKLKKGHGFCPFSRASDQSRNLAETANVFCRKLGGMGVWR